MMIEDGTGTGFKAKVNSINQIITESVVHSKGHERSHDNGVAFAVNTATTANVLTTTVTGGYIVYMKNNDPDTDIVIKGIEISTSVAGLIVTFVKNPTLGTIGNANAFTPVNLNFTSSVAVNVAANTWNIVGNGMTGFTGGTVFQSYVLGIGKWDFDFDGMLFIPQSGSLAITASGVVSSVTCNVQAYMHEKG